MDETSPTVRSKHLDWPSDGWLQHRPSTGCSPLDLYCTDPGSKMLSFSNMVEPVSKIIWPQLCPRDGGGITLFICLYGAVVVQNRMNDMI